MEVGDGRRKCGEVRSALVRSGPRRILRRLFLATLTSNSSAIQPFVYRLADLIQHSDPSPGANHSLNGTPAIQPKHARDATKNGRLWSFSRPAAYTVRFTREIHHERPGLDLPLPSGRLPTSCSASSNSRYGASSSCPSPRPRMRRRRQPWYLGQPPKERVPVD